MDTSVHPPIVHRLHYLLDHPRCDDLIQSFPTFLVSDALGRAITAADMTGFVLGDAKVEPGDNYRELGDAESSVSKYWWLHLSGSEGDDFWFTRDTFELGVSDRAMDLLRTFNLRFCDVTQLGD